MTLWLDAHLSPSLAPWIAGQFGIDAVAVRDVGLRDAGDMEIFTAARKADAIVLTKDADFPFLLSQHGTPPKVIWLTCGNTSNDSLKRILADKLPAVLKLLASGEEIVEITG